MISRSKLFSVELNRKVFFFRSNLVKIIFLGRTWSKHRHPGLGRSKDIKPGEPRKKFCSRNIATYRFWVAQNRKMFFLGRAKSQHICFGSCKVAQISSVVQSRNITILSRNGRKIPDLGRNGCNIPILSRNDCKIPDLDRNGYNMPILSRSWNGRNISPCPGRDPAQKPLKRFERFSSKIRAVWAFFFWKNRSNRSYLALKTAQKQLISCGDFWTVYQARFERF